MCAVGVACLLAGLSAAQAEGSPYALEASQSITHDSNVLRLAGSQQAPDGLSRADVVSSTGLYGLLDQSIGRQRLHANVDVRSTRFAHNSVYDGLAYALRTGVDWATVGRLSGAVNLGATRAQRPALRDLGDAVITEDNAESTRFFDARVSHGPLSRSTFELGYSRLDVDYAARASRFRNYGQQGISLAARHQFSADLRVGLTFRHTTVEYPFLLTSEADPLDRRVRQDLGLHLSWQPSGSVQVQGQLRHGSTRHDRLASRDFSASTGALQWSLDPGGRWRLDGSLAREAGQDDSVNSSVFSRTTDTLGLRARYQLAGKTVLNASLDWIRRNQQGFGGNLEGVAGQDSGSQAGIGITWSPMRSVSIGCSLKFEQRGSNSLPQIDESYRARTVACSGRIRID